MDSTVKDKPVPNKLNCLGATDTKNNVQEPTLYQLLEVLVEEIDLADKKKAHKVKNPLGYDWV